MFQTSRSKKEKKYNNYFLDDAHSIVSEQFRMLRTNIDFMSVDKKLQTFVITAADKEVGKTTVSFNLAAAFASQSKRVLLVEADLRRPRVHKLFNLRNDTGLTTLIMNYESDILGTINSTYIDNLYALTSGAIPPNPAELLSSKRMDEIIDITRNHFDIIIYDTPPITAVADAQIMAGKVDATLFVVRKDSDNKAAIRKSSDLLAAANANVIGAVFNRETRKKHNSYSYTGGDKYY